MDPIANMLVAIKNGYMANKNSVLLPYSKFKFEISKVLEKKQFVGKVSKRENRLEINLVYESGKPKISEIKRISKLGLRIYTKSKHIKEVKGGRGITVVSTSNGVMTASEARSKKLGGEVICQIW